MATLVDLVDLVREELAEVWTLKRMNCLTDALKAVAALVGLTLTEVLKTVTALVDLIRLVVLERTKLAGVRTLERTDYLTEALKELAVAALVDLVDPYCSRKYSKTAHRRDS